MPRSRAAAIWVSPRRVRASRYCEGVTVVGTTCQHHVGWKWDGSLDLGDDLEELKRAWGDVCALVDEHGEDPAFKRLVTEEVGADADRQQTGLFAD
jgi:hypothetical protein